MQERVAVTNENHRSFSGFYKLQDIECNAATPSSIAFANLKENIKLKLPKLEDLPEYRKIKGHSVPIALVGGGPSLKDNLDDLRQFRTIIACGSSHDYLRENNIIPTYATICDPDIISVNYYKKLHTEVKYLISTGVDPLLIDHFKEYQCALWHCHSNDYDIDEIVKLEGRLYHAISGGCTVGLRSLSMAIMLGYTNIHFFGFDSCMSGPECHAYEVSAEERKSFGRLFPLKLRDLHKGDGDGPGDKTYYCAGYQLAQAHNFKDFVLNFGKLFEPTFHGEGLLPDFYKLIIDVLGVGNVPTP